MRRLLLIWMSFAVVGLLTACGGGSGGGNQPQKFTTSVADVVSQTSDDQDPLVIDDVATGADDTSEPDPVS